MNADFLRPLVFCCLASTVVAQQSLESDYRTTGTMVVAAFEAQRAVLQSSSAVILDGHKECGYGVVVSAEGHILTKASEVAQVEKLAVTVDHTNFPEVKILAVDPEWDVALLKVEASGLIPVRYAPTSDIPQGSWVVANGATSRTKRRLLAGIISAKIREIPAAGGAALGLVLNPNSKRLEVDDVNEKSGAKEAGIQKGDQVLAIDGKPVKDLKEIAEIMKDRKAGTHVKLTYRRGKEENTVEVRLAAKSELFDEQKNRNDMMSGDFSKRRSGFPRVMQTDILCNSKSVGGPLIDLEGQCVGMNIARANRAETFAIPVEDMKALAERLMKQPPMPDLVPNPAAGPRDSGDDK